MSRTEGSSVIVYVVSRVPGPLVSFIKRTGVYRESSVEVRPARSVPTARDTEEQGVTIIDLSNPPDGLLPPKLACRARMQYILLVNRRQSVAFSWVEFARSGLVRLVGLPPDSAEPFGPLVTVLERLNNRLSPQRVARALAQRNPLLQSLEDLTRLVLTRPWRIRRPSDLAYSACMPEEVLRERCQAAGFRRIEHFVTLVRGLAYEFLTGAEGLAPRRARLVVGISDPANFRRQRRTLQYLDRVS